MEVKGDIPSALPCLSLLWSELPCHIHKGDCFFSPLSQHDTTLVALQMALDVYNKIQPPYASCHLFELYQEDDG